MALRIYEYIIWKITDNESDQLTDMAKTTNTSASSDGDFQ